MLVLENDPKEIPIWLKSCLGGREYEVWYDFTMSFTWDKEAAFKRLKETKGLLVSSPSFVGQGNSFEHYLLLFYKLKELNIPVKLAILYPKEPFYIHLLKFLSEWQTILKKENNHRILKEVLDFHSIYEIPYTYLNSDLSKMKIITYEGLLENYVETQKNPTLFKTKTGEIYPAYHVWYNNPIEDTEIILRIESSNNNQFLLKDLERV